MRVPLLMLLFLLAGCSSPPADDDPAAEADCTGHRHATFAVAFPDDTGNLAVLDLAAPKDAQGRTYYQLGIAPNQDVGLHMHQSGPEAGSPEHQVTQLHLERDGCIDVADGLRAIDVTATVHGLKVAGMHERAGSWTAGDGDDLHVYLQSELVSEEGQCAWVWQERAPGTALDHVLSDGESFLVVFGDPAPGNVASVQEGIPAPEGRQPADC